MLSNNDIKFIRSLSQKKNRDESGLFVVEGEKMVSEALSSDYTVEKVIYMDEIGEERMSRITQLSSPSPVLAIVRKKDHKPLTIECKGLYLALDSIKDPGNLGTILRIVDWFGLNGIFASKDSVELYNPKVIQASMGSVFRVRLQYADLAQILEDAKKSLMIFGTFLHNASNIYKEKLDKNGIIILGNESCGISQEIEKKVDKRLYIPNFSYSDSCSPDSLNIAVAAAIVCSEFRRVSV
ncbi:MAG TPA: RNA methyltransferase [Bacteroidales bacterium]|nr:RNA methyltransferase [Bacteroidales bacterium]